MPASKNWSKHWCNFFRIFWFLTKKDFDVTCSVILDTVAGEEKRLAPPLHPRFRRPRSMTFTTRMFVWLCKHTWFQFHSMWERFVNRSFNAMGVKNWHCMTRFVTILCDEFKRCQSDDFVNVFCPQFCKFDVSSCITYLKYLYHLTCQMFKTDTNKAHSNLDWEKLTFLFLSFQVSIF